MHIDPTPLDPRATPLKRMKTIAAALLLVALVGLALAHAMGNAGIWAWVRAFCEASAIGAVADWFAVVALFRHPLGLKIPHTAVIPNGKARLADGLADFVRDHFLEPQALLAKPMKILDGGQKVSHVYQGLVVALSESTLIWMAYLLDIQRGQLPQSFIQSKTGRLFLVVLSPTNYDFPRKNNV